jgi:hypothetical protein
VKGQTRCGVEGVFDLEAGVSIAISSRATDPYTQLEASTSPRGQALNPIQVPIVLCLREMRDLNSYLTHTRGLLEHVRLIVIPHPEGTVPLPEELAVNQSAAGVNGRW